MDYSPLNPVIWLIFAIFIAVIYLAVKIFHGRYPNYPYEETEEDQ